MGLGLGLGLNECAPKRYAHPAFRALLRLDREGEEDTRCLGNFVVGSCTKQKAAMYRSSRRPAAEKVTWVGDDS